MDDQAPLVLITEDESDLAELYARWLKTEYRVRTAHSGEEAIEQLDDEIDVILIDRLMPGLCGTEVVEVVHERGIDCRVLIVTAMERESCNTEIKCDDYVLKPIRQDTLIETTEDLLSAASTEGRQQSHH